MDESTNKRAIIVGAGMAGLMAAAATSESFDEVLVLEKDDLPNKPELRKGVPPGAHVHTFLGYTVEAMEELFPGIMDRIYAEGAVKIRRNKDIWFHDYAGPTPIRDVGILTPSVTRPLLEHVTRHWVMALPNVNLRDSTRVKDFETDDNGKVIAVTVESSGEQEQISADLVVECSGRGGDIALRDPEGFVEWARGLAHPIIYEKFVRAESVSELRNYKIPQANGFDTTICHNSRRV